MPLTWDVTNVKDKNVVTTHPEDLANNADRKDWRWNPVTECIVFGLMAAGIREITAENIEQVWYRIGTLEVVLGGSLNLNGERVCLTKADLIQHIGLTTNVSTKSAKAFDVQLLQMVKDKARRDRRALENCESVSDRMLRICRERAHVGG